MTYLWIAVIIVVVLYTLYLIWFNKKWCLLETVFTDEEYFKIAEILRVHGIKYFTKMAIDWGRPPGQTTVIDHKQIDFYVRRQDEYNAKQALSRQTDTR